MNRNITDVWKQVNKQEHLPKGKNYLELVAMAEDADHDDIEVDLPVLRVYYHADKSRNSQQ